VRGVRGDGGGVVDGVVVVRVRDLLVGVAVVRRDV